MQVVVNSLITNYQSAGKGRAIVCVHGWGDNAKTFDQLVKLLSTNYHVISLDLPGFGGSDAPKEAWGLNEYASFVRDFVKKIGVSNVNVFMGHSNGGAILIYGLANNLLLAGKLVLLSSAGIRNEQQARKNFLRYLAKVAKLVIKPLPKGKQLALRKVAYKALGSDMFVAEHLQESFKRVVNTDVQADASNLKLPTLLIYGDQDDATPAKYGEKFAAVIKDSELQILAGDHFIHQQQPLKVFELIKGFLQ